MCDGWGTSGGQVGDKEGKEDGWKERRMERWMERTKGLDFRRVHMVYTAVALPPSLSSLPSLSSPLLCSSSSLPSLSSPLLSSSLRTSHRRPSLCRRKHPSVAKLYGGTAAPPPVAPARSGCGRPVSRRPPLRRRSTCSECAAPLGSRCRAGSSTHTREGTRGEQRGEQRGKGGGDRGGGYEFVAGIYWRMERTCFLSTLNHPP